jgi:hypothetical protein
MKKPKYWWVIADCYDLPVVVATTEVNAWNALITEMLGRETKQSYKKLGYHAVKVQKVQK